MIRIGIVGCGRILNAHLQGYKKLRELGLDNFRITALVARREADARMFLRRGEGPPPRPPVLPPESGDPLAAPHTYLSDLQDDVDVQVYTDYREMLERAPVDAVNDFTSLAMHHQVGLAALSAGKHLLTEKPLAISVRAARRMVELAQQRGLTLGVFENVRQLRIVRAAHWAVRRGLIGRPQMAIIGSLGGLWSPDRVVADTPWRHRKLEAGGGGAVDIGVHHFHWLRYVLGEVAWVSAVTRTFEPVRYRRDEAGRIVETVTADVDDTYLAVAGFEDGAIAQMLWSWAGRGEPLEIPGTPAFYGSEGCIKGSELIYGDSRRESLMERFEREMSAEERERFFPLGLTDPFAIQQLDWLRAIEQGCDPETSGREGLRDLACAFALLESATLGRRVTVEEVLSGVVAAYQADIDAHYQL
ncbi:MAG: Gfo/Idh/MocA family oxidoreductase [Anaerolineae bacterium]|nr:Gfo/Idh/MocA family oxidoreductase [Anaerolineae bacterium]MDW8099297.1 Gfo/Idh/MocA family oxidoreductase [Anaerolineae bacterium]